MTQQSLLEPVYSVPPAVTEFLAGFAGRLVFGEKRTAAQERAAARAAEDMARRLADLRCEAAADRSPVA